MPVDHATVVLEPRYVRSATRCIVAAMYWSAALVLGAAACGRLGFEGSGTADAPSGDGDVGGCGSPRRLCDGFEGPSLDPRWVSSPGITLDSSRAHRGASSLHVHADPLAVGEGTYVTISESTILPRRDPTIYVRAWVQVDRMPKNNMAILGAVATTDFLDGVFIIPDAMTVYSQFAGASWETPGPPPLSTWFCLRWTIVRSRTAGSLLLEGDVGTASLQNIATEGAEGLDYFQIGISFADINVDSPEPAMDVWIDDVILSTSPLTCTD